MWAWSSNFLDENSPFLPGYTFKLGGNNWIEGDPEPLFFNIVVSYTVVSEKCKKKNWNWRNNRLFCHIFLIGEISIEGARPPAPPLGYAHALSEENKKGLRKFSPRFLAFSNEISTAQKILLSSSRGRGNFRGLEASRPRQRTWPSRPRPRTSKCVLEANDILKDSTSVPHGSKQLLENVLRSTCNAISQLVW